MGRFMTLARGTIVSSCIVAIAFFSGCEGDNILTAENDSLPSEVTADGTFMRLAKDPPSGGGSGAIFTTTPDGSIVNENVHYESKSEVYLDGGPPPNAPATAAGLDDGFYVFQITDPPGKLLLSVDPARCRVVEISGGVITRLVPPTEQGLGATTDNWSDESTNGKFDYAQEPCHQDPNGGGPGLDPVDVPAFYGLGRHDTNTDTDHGSDAGAIVVQMMPYGSTPNPGGVYKAWLTPLTAYVGVKGADLNDIPKDINGRVRPHDCPNFCADADPGFVPSHRYTKTDNFKVTEQFPAEILVRKFHDLDYNGKWDDGEPEIGVDECVDANGLLIACGPGGWPYDFTEPLNGGPKTDTYYTPFTHVVAFPGTYSAEEYYFPDIDNGGYNKWRQTASWLDLQYQTPFQKKVDVPVEASAPGETHEIRFGNTRLARIRGKKVIDYDADGVIDPGDICPSASADETNNHGCEGVTVKLTGTDGMGEPVSKTTTTGAGGHFEFKDLYPGVYKVEIVEPSGFFCSYPTDGACFYDNIVLKSGDYVDLDTKVTGDAAFADWKPGEKSGLKFEDHDGQGDKTNGDDGLGGWVIHLLQYDGAWKKVDETTTAAETGAYKFTNLKPGVKFAVCEVLKEGWQQTSPTSGFDCDAVEPAGTDYAKFGHEFTLTSGQAHENNDFGNFELVDVKICKLKDGDGLVSTTGDRTPKPGWKVALTLNNEIVDEQYTEDPDGCFMWKDLPALPRGGTFTKFGKTLSLPSGEYSYYDAKEETKDGWVSLGAFDNDGTFIPYATDVDFEAPPKSGSKYTATFVNTPTQGCTPGFWQGGPADKEQAGGQWLWNEPNDPEWKASGGQGWNPFVHADDFDSFFGGTMTGLTMLELVETGGTSDDARKAARSLVAAYLNASWGVAYAYTTTELKALWEDALGGQISFLSLHTMLDNANNAPGGCPISASGF